MNTADRADAAFARLEKLAAEKDRDAALLPMGDAAEMAAQVEGPTQTVAAVQAARRKNAQAFRDDPVRGAVDFVDRLPGLLGLLGL